MLRAQTYRSFAALTPFRNAASHYPSIALSRQASSISPASLRSLAPRPSFVAQTARQCSTTATGGVKTQMPAKKDQKQESQNNEQPMAKGGAVEAPATGWDGPVPSSKGGSDEGYMLKPPYYWQRDEFKPKYKASCWCGRIKFEYHGDPIDAKHCHCTQCQRLHGAPFQWAALYHKTSVRLSHDSDPSFLSFFSTHRKGPEHDVPCKVACASCHSPLLDEGRNMVMAYPSSFQFEDQRVPPAFAPSAHIFYGEALVEIDDGVPKWSGHKDHSELMPHKIGRHGKLGHGQAGQEKRGEKKAIHHHDHADENDKKRAKMDSSDGKGDANSSGGK